MAERFYLRSPFGYLVYDRRDARAFMDELLEAQSAGRCKGDAWVEEMRKRLWAAAYRNESAIEDMLLFALFFIPARDFAEPVILMADKIDMERPAGSLTIYPQMPVGPYRADFIVQAKTASRNILIDVEADGYEFHDAEHDRRRDEYFAGKGFYIYRLNARQIRRDWLRCISEIGLFVTTHPMAG